MALVVVFFDLGQTLVRTGNSPAWVPGAPGAMNSLRKAGIRLGVISNTGTLSREELAGLLPPDFDWARFEPELILLSSEVGLEKPDLGIFLEAFRRAGVPPAQCLFCTESTVDALQAQRAGMRALRVGAPVTNGLEEISAALGVLGEVPDSS